MKTQINDKKKDLVPIILALFGLFILMIIESPMFPYIVEGAGLSKKTASANLSQQVAATKVSSPINIFSFIAASVVIIIIGAIFAPLAWLMIIGAAFFIFYSGSMKGQPVLPTVMKKIGL